MAIQLFNRISPTREQRFILPGRYGWQKFKAIQALIEQLPGVRLSYLDGCVEFMTTGEEHERIKTNLGFLIELYLCEKEIEYRPVGSATREAESQGASFEPDESYYLDRTRQNPDLAVEVAIASGGIDKLEKYRRFEITEVWFWESERLSVYCLRGDRYEQTDRSELLPELDLELLVRCVQMPSRPSARKIFLQGIGKSSE